MNLKVLLAEGEHKYQEFKERYVKGMLKTVSAFANDHDGRIVIGVSDNGRVLGVEDSKSARLQIENAINDSLRPRPYYEVDTYVYDGKEVLVFTIFKGDRTPYLCQKKAYQRMDTSTVEADKDRYDELVLFGRNLTFEELVYEADNVTFATLENKLSEALNIGSLDENVLRSLELLSSEGYNTAAGLLSDKNRFTRIGLDIIKYRDNKMTVMDDRVSLSGTSILEHYDQSLQFYRKYIRNMDIIKSEKRQSFAQVPLVAYREAVINALIHRDYRKQGNNRIEFFEDRIEILSVGGLLSGVSKEEFIKGSYSSLRNRIIADIFFRLGYIEKMGTGIRRIKESYAEYSCKPVIDVMQNSIRIELPFIDESNLSSEAEVNKPEVYGELARLYNFIQANDSVVRADVESYMNIGKTKAVSLLSQLVDMGLVERSGSAKTTKYHIK